tara:strand:+ start:93 stop:788 length:696 start_codon:yes stop_codon:yes gene_type:complete
MENIAKSWCEIFDNYNSNHTFKIQDILNSIEDKKQYYQDINLNNKIYPNKENIFRAFKYFDINNTKVVILGQDPYYKNELANGLCFGTENNTIPASLRNIAKELKNDLNIVIKDYSLESWAKQNVLLLNSSLSVIEFKPGSMMTLWRDFTKYIINQLNDCQHSIIFVSWGAFAHKQLININTNKHKLIVSSHPSPLSVYKKYKEFTSFNNSKIFSKINNYLIENNDKPIDW